MAIDFEERARREEAAAPWRHSAQPSPRDSFGIEAQARRQWEADPALRAEFGGRYEAWLAYRKANAKGLVRIISRSRNA